MKRIGLIDNLQDIPHFLANNFETANASECMAATGGNTGNVAFVYAARKILGNPTTRVGWGSNPKIVRERADHLVICCANQLGMHTDLGTWADRLELLELPVTLLGLGAQSESFNNIPEIPVGTKRFLEVVKQLKGPADINIAVRGDFTHNVLSHLGVPSLPIGCPSLHISPERELGASILQTQAKHKVQRVAVAAGNPWHGPSAWLEQILVAIVDAYQGDYIIQHPEAMLQFAFGETQNITPQTKARFLEVYGSNFHFEGLLEWYRKNAAVYIDAATWIRSLRRFDLAVGPRYHGVALAVQAGRPGCVLTIDSRTEELCLGTNLKYLTLQNAKNLSTEEVILQSLWTPDDATKFDAGRLEKARSYCDFLEQNELQPSEHLRRIAALT